MVLVMPVVEPARRGRRPRTGNSRLRGSATPICARASKALNRVRPPGGAASRLFGKVTGDPRPFVICILECAMESGWSRGVRSGAWRRQYRRSERRS